MVMKSFKGKGFDYSQLYHIRIGTPILSTLTFVEFFYSLFRLLTVTHVILLITNWEWICKNMMFN